MPTDAAQLTLPVALRDDATLENFLFPPALGVLAGALKRQMTARGDEAIYLHGPEGSGRSHLLQAACHAIPDGDGLYLPLDQLREQEGADVLAGIETLARVCLDDIHSIAGSASWELALFHLINRCRDTGCRLLFSANRAPRQLDITLPDLRSRLSWSTVFQLCAPDDADKLRILQFRAQRRGMKLNDESGRYILSRAPRGMSALMGVLERLDRDSIAARRPLTIPFIKERMGW